MMPVHVYRIVSTVCNRKNFIRDLLQTPGDPEMDM